MEDWLAQAKNPETTGSQLRELLARCDERAPHRVWDGIRYKLRPKTEPEADWVRKAIAGNPSCPTEELLALVPFHTNAVLSNPALPLLLLERPTLFAALSVDHFALLAGLSKLSEEQLRVLCPTPESIQKHTPTLLKIPAVPEDFFESMQQPDHHELWLAMAVHPNASKDRLVACLQCWLPEVRKAVLRHKNLPQEQAQRLWNAGASDDMALPSHLPVPLPEEEVLWLAEQGPFAQLLAAINPTFKRSITAVEKLKSWKTLLSHWQASLLLSEELPCGDMPQIFSSDESIREHASALLKHPKTPPDLLARIDVADERQALEMTKHASAPTERLGRCLAHASREVRQRAQKHPNSPRDVQERLRRAGATSALEVSREAPPELPESELRWLSSQGEFSALLAALNPATPLSMLEELAGRNDDITTAVLKHPRVTAALIEKLWPGDWYQRQGRPSGGQLVREEKQQAGHGSVLRSLLARHMLTPPAMLATLANDKEPSVRAAVATHPELPPRALLDLGLDDHPSVLLAALRNPDLPPEAIDVIARNRPPAGVAIRVAKHPNTSRWALRQISKGEHEEARNAAVQRLTGAG